MLASLRAIQVINSDRIQRSRAARRDINGRGKQTLGALNLRIAHLKLRLPRHVEKARHDLLGASCSLRQFLQISSSNGSDCTG